MFFFYQTETMLVRARDRAHKPSKRQISRGESPRFHSLSTDAPFGLSPLVGGCTGRVRDFATITLAIIDCVSRKRVLLLLFSPHFGL